MLLAVGVLNNGFTAHGAVERRGDGIIRIYFGSRTTNGECKVHARPRDRHFLTYFWSWSLKINKPQPFVYRKYKRIV